MSQFIDTLTLRLKAGDGGDGIISFRREKFIPKGGPDGGDGGAGGDIILIARSKLSNLIHLRTKPLLKSEYGKRGGPARLSGGGGKPHIIEVPLGTVIKTLNGIIIHDFKQPDEQLTLLKGGKGGRGNYHFRSSVNKAPRKAEKGTLGKEISIHLELKIIADVGLVGLPNAGKSTLIGVLTQAHPKIAAYPFTTLSPNLGIYALDHKRTLVLADIPGIIDGAHSGKGLGLEFLRHIERTTLLLYLIDCSIQTPTPAATLKLLQHELFIYNDALRHKPVCLALTKAELLSTPAQQAAIRKTFPKPLQEQLIFISSHTHYGLTQLKRLLQKAFSH